MNVPEQEMTIEEMKSASSALMKQCGNVSVEVMRDFSAILLKQCTEWIKQASDPLCFSRKEHDAMIATIENLNAFPAFAKKWELYRKLLIINNALDFLNATIGKMGNKKLQELKTGKGMKELDEVTEISKATSIILDLIIHTLNTRYRAMYYGQSEKKPILEVDIGRIKIKTGEVKWAAKVLNSKVKNKDIYLMKKFFRINN